MNKKLVNSQLTNMLTYNKVRRKMTTLASNVFLFPNLEEVAPYIDQDYINKKLIYNGAVAWFKDEELGLLCLPFQTVGRPDLYGRPVSIMVQGANGYTKTLNVLKDEAVIMYDNAGKYPLINDIIQDAERIALCKRIQDINISQQKCNRVWTTNKDQEKTVQDLLNQIDGNVENVIAYDTIDINTINSVLGVAPYITDKLDDHLRTLWEEFYSHIGISSLLVQKRERVIRDEMRASMGGTIASRYIRFNPRKIALEKIKKLWGYDIELEFYDGLPTTIEEFEDYIEDDTPVDNEEVDINE